MWQRFIRALAATLQVYTFATSPLRFIITLVTILMVPYLVYIFWGSVILFLLMAVGGYLLYRAYKNGGRSGVRG